MVTRGSAYSIIWLDAHIGMEAACSQLKTEFMTNLCLIAAVPPILHDPEIDGSAIIIPTYNRPIEFYDDPDAALSMIKRLCITRKVVLITSATMGESLISKIKKEKIPMFGYYIFCSSLVNNTSWIVEHALEGLNILAFDFESDLLIRLARDITKEFIKEGQILLDLGLGNSASTYFTYARSIAENAVLVDAPMNDDDRHIPSATHRNILDGPNGLIQRAKNCKAAKPVKLLSNDSNP
jgi:hypothetical protein